MKWSPFYLQRLEDEERHDKKPLLRPGPRTPLKKLLEDESLDNLPGAMKKEVPSHKFVESPVRKKAERKILQGFDCIDCKNYYAGANLVSLLLFM
jgi:hypothetical protein